MKDEAKTEEQLVQELVEMRQRVAESEASETERRRAEERLAKQAVDLSEINESLKEKDRLLDAFDQIGQAVLSSLDLEQVLDPLGEQIVKTGIFRSLMIALVDEQTRTVEVARVFIFLGDGFIGRDGEAIGTRYDLDDPNITAEVARTGEMQVIVEWDDRLDTRFNTPEEQKGQVAYFIPVKKGNRALAVLATASGIEEQEETLHRIEVMRPLLNEVAIALEHAQLYEALRESEERYRELADSITDVFFAMDKDLRYTYWNRASEALTGIPAKDALGKSLYELFPDTPQTRRAAKVYSDVLRTQQSQSFVTEYELGGKDYFLEISAYPSVRGLSVFVRDITAHKRAEEALRKRTHDLGERVKELNCLYGIADLIEKSGISSEEIFQGTVDLIPPSWRYPEIICARIISEGREFSTENFRETIWRQASDIMVYGEQIGTVEICYLEERPESDGGPFLKEERLLINAIAERLGRITERRQAEEVLRRRTMPDRVRVSVYEMREAGDIQKVLTSL